MAKTAAQREQSDREVASETGKGASRRARRDGKVPAVLYGHGADPQHLTAAGPRLLGRAAELRHQRRADPRHRRQGAARADQGARDPPDPPQHPARRPARRPPRREGDRRGQRRRRGRCRPRHPGHTRTPTPSRSSPTRMSIPEQLHASRSRAPRRARSSCALEVPLPDGVTLISDPEHAGGQRRPAPTAEELESEGRRERRRGAPRAKRAPRRAEAARTHPPKSPSNGGNRGGRATAGGRPGQSRAAVRQDPAQPRLPRRRHPGRPHRARRSRCTRSPAPRWRRVGSAGGRWCWPNRGST